MRVYQEIDVQNPFIMSDILSGGAWDNVYLIQRNGRLDELEEILESYEEWDLGELDYYLANEVQEQFPDLFGLEDEDDDEYSYDEE